MLAFSDFRPQGLVGVGYLPRARLHGLFQAVHLRCGAARDLPLRGQRARHLAHLDGIEGLLQDQQAVTHIQPPQNLAPGVVRIGGADHDLQGGVFLPELLDGLHAIPAESSEKESAGADTESPNKDASISSSPDAATGVRILRKSAWIIGMSSTSRIRRLCSSFMDSPSTHTTVRTAATSAPRDHLLRFATS